MRRTVPDQKDDRKLHLIEFCPFKHAFQNIKKYMFNEWTIEE